jgi:hypothetical protein
MLTSISRLFALRPFFTTAIIGIPLIMLVAIGLFTVMAVKFFIFVVLPIGLVVWLFRRVFGRPRTV